MTGSIKRALLSAGVAVGTAGLALAGGAPAAHASSINVVKTWQLELASDNGGPVLLSSPAVANLAGGPAAVVGDTSGKVWAFHLADGSTVPGWPGTTFDGGAVDSPVSVNGSEVYAGVGSYAKPTIGGFQAFSGNGAQAWHQTLTLLPNNGGGNIGVIAGLAVGTLHGVNGVVAGTLGQQTGAFNAGTGGALAGFPWYQADSIQSTAALADLYGNGVTDIVEGGASTAGLSYGIQYVNGGHVRVISPTGGLICNYNTLQPVSASPAVGRFLPGGAVGIVAATVKLYTNQGGVDQLMGFNSHCGPAWTYQMATGYIADSSPAVVNALGNGQLQIAETAHDPGNTAGTTYLVNGTTGTLVWATPSLGAAVGGPVSVDLGGGYQDLVVAGTGGVQILDGRTGQVLWQATSSNRSVPMMQNSALVTDDPNGTVGITLAGYNAVPFDSEVVHYEISGSRGSLVSETGGWPEFHHDPKLTGNAGTPPPVVNVPCSAPTTTPTGYYMAAADGGVFNYGNLPYCGSLGNVALNKPIVGMAPTHDGGGYWLVASDGGIFTFGDAKFYGSAGAVHLAKPVVGMAVTPDGGGYYLVASDGGVFTYGDARFHGSAGNVALVKPIVGIATDPTGAGYWMVASDGGVFSYGAPFHGSAGNVRLVKPIVGMASNANGSGYWLVASDGGIFSYGARFFGSAGGAHLVKPVVGMAATPDGGGYWMVASDGGIFNYGDAPYKGSAGGVNLASPVQALAGL
jgi:hypothetical protein